MNKSIEQIIEELSQPIPPEFLYTRKQGNTELTYISWHGAVRLLDMYAPGWSGQVVNILETPNYCYVTYRISIPTDNGVVHRDATGSESITNHLAGKGYGDPSSNAESMAFRRAASKYGLGLYLYSKNKSTQHSTPSSTSRPPKARYPKEVVQDEEYEF